MVDDAERAVTRFRPVDWHRPIDLPGGGTALYRRAGHILGAATVEVRCDGLTLAFSGDLGRYDDPLMVDPEPVPQADYVVVESTYGDRIHERRDPLEALAEVVERTVKRGGTVVIPAFAVGRAQQLLYFLWRLRQTGRLGLAPVYLDSPMAINASELFCRHPDDHRLSAEDARAACGVATYVRDVEGSKALSANPMPKVILSASGMATGGRVLHHIEAFGRDRRNTILFSGFQAAGTRGRSLLEGRRELKMFGRGRRPADAVGPRRRRRTHALAGGLPEAAQARLRGPWRARRLGRPARAHRPRPGLGRGGSPAGPGPRPVRPRRPIPWSRRCSGRSVRCAWRSGRRG